jgi:hypothetical protein
MRPFEIEGRRFVELFKKTREVKSQARLLSKRIGSSRAPTSNVCGCSSNWGYGIGGPARAAHGSAKVPLATEDHRCESVTVGMLTTMLTLRHFSAAIQKVIQREGRFRPPMQIALPGLRPSVRRCG